MKMNRQRAIKAFQDYTSHYDVTDEKVKLKIDHTYRVSSLCQQIAVQSGFDKDETELAWLTGLLHDVGRFEQLKTTDIVQQLRRYGTFMDAQSIDHAEFGADILFKEGKIRDYIEDASEDELLEKAVRCHSAYRVPAQYTAREKKFADLLRDADKIDILKVNIIVPLEEIYNVTTYELNVVGHISLAYELVYPISCKLVSEQGYLDQLMNFQSELPQTNAQFAKIREKMAAYLKQKEISMIL